MQNSNSNVTLIQDLDGIHHDKCRVVLIFGIRSVCQVVVVIIRIILCSVHRLILFYEVQLVENNEDNNNDTKLDWIVKKY